MKFVTKALLGAGALALMSGMAVADAHGSALACLITKNNTNPFFVKMKEGAEAAATAAGLDFQAYAGEKTAMPPRRSLPSKTASPLVPRVS
jgi:fructose transport system substrate-binding protein